MKNLREILLFSGGLDSFIAWEYLNRPMCIYFDLGHKYAKQELERVNLLAEVYEDMAVIITTDIKMAVYEDETAHIPLRNLFLISYASLHANKIWLVVQKGELDLPDRSITFFALMNRTLRVAQKDSRIIVDSPFFKMTKADMIGWYIKAGYPVHALKQTWSCYHPARVENRYIPCGQCSACFRRWAAMAYNNIEEEYYDDPWEAPIVSEYIQKLQNGEYDPDRTKQTMKVLRRYGRI